MSSPKLVLDEQQSHHTKPDVAMAHITRADRLFRNLVLKGMRELKGGSITVCDGCETVTLGEQTNTSLHTLITVQDHSFYKDVVFGGNLGVAEAYLQGKWTCDNLTNLIRIFCRNLDQSEKMNRGFSRFAIKAAKGAHRLAHNSLQGSKRNIAAHYDLSNDFFQLFLDPTMMYSSAYYSHPEMSLEQASLDKLDLICRRLDLKPEDKVLEIGTGWGGFARHAVQNYGCHVTTTTISDQQHQFAQKRFQESGVDNKVTLLSEDYRNLTGQYDKVVSIEMIEAVGQQYLAGYFQKCASLLKPRGKLLIQAITIPDQRYAAYCRSVDFINKYIFPGGHLPSVGAMQTAASNGTNLRFVKLEDFGQSYALTLREWRSRFFKSIDLVKDLGFDDRFIRMWDYYLSYCEGAFLEQSVGVSHLIWQSTEY